MTSENMVEVRPRLRLPREVAEKLEGLSMAARSELVVQALAAPKLDEMMERWYPAALRIMADALEDAAKGRLQWAPKSEDEKKPAYLYQPHILEGWAWMLREASWRGKS